MFAFLWDLVVERGKKDKNGVYIEGKLCELAFVGGVYSFSLLP